MGSRALILKVSIGLLFAGAFFLATPGAAQQAKSLKIGALVASSGWFSAIEATDVADLMNMVKIINEKGGVTIKGQRYDIEIVTEDTKSTFDGCTAGANRLVFDKKVKFVLGPGGFFGPAAAPVFNPNKVLYVLGYATTQPGALGQGLPYGFLANIGSVGSFTTGCKALKSEFPNAKKVALVLPDDGAVPYLIPAVRRVLTLNGYTEVGEVVAFPNEMQDFSPVAAKLDAIKDADAILQVNGIPSQVGNILKNLRDLGNTKPYVGTAGSGATDITTIAGASAATNLVCLSFTLDDPSNPPLMKELIRRRTEAKTRFMGDYPNLLYVLVNMMKAADSLDVEAVKAKWEKSNIVETLFGTGTVSGDQTYGIKHHAVGYPFPYQRVQDGKIVLTKWVDMGAVP
ncbi:MAG TPA: ABC transporter substrate-binding protein [Syntrophorhabdales bacterium]|nr:ABC transporter substrate-binding protein [Syntrophorhabdales bacterium]